MQNPTPSSQPFRKVNFNGLTPAEAERLAWLAEECAETIHAVGKILRHGYESRDPTVDGSPTNRVTLELELGDVRAATEWLASTGDIRKVTHRESRTMRYMHHQEGEES